MCCHLPGKLLSFQSFFINTCSLHNLIMNSGQPPSKRKKTKPKLDIWVNFSYRDGDKRAVCLHCNKDVMKRADVIKLHLKSCASYQLILSTENDNTTNQSSDANQSKSVSADVKKVPNTRMIE